MKARNPRSFWSQVGLLAAKDLKVFIADKGALAFALVFPFAFVLLFSMVMGGSLSGPDKAVDIYLATAEPAGSISRQVVEELVASAGAADPGSAAGGDAGGGTATSTSSVEVAGGLAFKLLEPAEASQLLVEEKIGAYLLFPEGFSTAIIAGEPATVTVYYLPGATTNRAATLSVAQAIAGEFQSYKILYQAVGELAGGGPMPAWPGLPGTSPGLATPAGAEGLGIDLNVEKVGDIVPPKASDYLIPGYLTMFVFFALALTAEAFVGEKENYTLERLIAGSASRLTLVTGKILGSFARGLVQVAVFWIAGILIFHVRMGFQPWAVVLVSVLLTLAASGVGVFLATVIRSRKGAASAAVFVSLAFAAFGGSWWPLFIMPQWLQNLAKVTPHAWANSAFNKLMLFGASAANVVPEMIALAAFAVVFGGVAVWRFTASD